MSGLWMACALFFPRLTLLCTYLFGSMPANDTPFWADFFAALFVPRLLIAYWAHGLGEHIVWVALFVLLGASELLGGGSRAASRGD